MMDFILIAVILLIVAAAEGYVIKAKKSGAKCIGCPVEGGCCSHHQSHTGSCCHGCGGADSSRLKDK